MPLKIFSEPISPNGNIIGHGILNQLGRPALDPITILVREAVQNSWDARQNPPIPIIFGLKGWVLTKQQRDVLKKEIFKELPSKYSLPLSSILDQEKIKVLAIYDRGTVGLGGPTRADVLSSTNEHGDFVDFLRNIGQPSDRDLTGGTYGYGKAAFYRMSRAQTIVVHTHCTYLNQKESRLIASALGNSFSTINKRFTGRHWWGKINNNIVDPILNNDADLLASKLGLQGFSTNECGTTILIIEPDLDGVNLNGHEPQLLEIGERTPLQALNFAAESILMYFWPKMISIDSKPPVVSFEISWEGQNIRIPKPEDYPPLAGFVEAFLRCKSKPQNDSGFPFKDQSITRFSQKIGKLVLQKYAQKPFYGFDTGNSIESQFKHLTHHTAVMRHPELVVKYLAGPALPTESLGYSGVFICDIDLDHVFAHSEPPSHDSWNPDSINDRKEKLLVRFALKDIERKMEEFAVPPPSTSSDGIFAPLGAFANLLGISLLIGAEGPSATYLPINTTPVKPSNIEKKVNGKSDNKTQLQNEITTTSVDVVSTVFNPILAAAGKGSDLLGNTPAGTNLINSVDNPQISASQLPPLGKSKLSLNPDSHYLLADGLPALSIEFLIEHGQNSGGTLVHALTRAVIDGDQLEKDPPIGGSVSNVLYWVNSEGEMLRGSSKIFVPNNITGLWRVVVSVPDDIMLSVELESEAVRGNNG